MTQAETLIALAEKVEKLAGPSDEIDARIEAEIQRPKHPDAAAVKVGKVYGAAACRTKGKRGWRAFGLFFQRIRYTGSLDAAMTLVPEGCLWTLDSLEGPLWTAGIWRPQTGWAIYPHDHTKTATPALALTAASLRARAASLTGEG